MIPGNIITPSPIISAFLYPYSNAYNPYSQDTWGGIALNNPSQGRMYQIWNVTWDGQNINVGPKLGSTVFTMAVSGIKSVSLAFDNNMAIVLCWKTVAGGYLYWYDTIGAQYTTTFYPGLTSCMVCVDNSQDFYNAASDVMFAYTDGTNCYWRQQRDRYATQYLVGATTKRLIRFGPSTGNRLQFELR